MENLQTEERVFDLKEEQLKRRVLEIIDFYTKVEFDEITNDKTLDDLGLDSMDKLEIVYEIENTLHVKISNEELKNIKTVGDIIKHVSGLYI